MSKEDLIEKAVKHQPGDVHPKYPDLTWQQNKSGKWTWLTDKTRKKTSQARGQGGGTSSSPKQDDYSQQSSGGQKTSQQQSAKVQTPNSNRSFEDMTPDEIVSYAESASTNALEAVINDKKQNKDIRQIAFNVLKKRSDYDRTKVDSSDLSGGHTPKKQPKIQYKTKKPADGIEFEVPDEWTIRGKDAKTGRNVNKPVSASSLRKLFESKTDDQIIDELKNDSLNPNRAQLLYEEAASRGISEDKIHIPEKLQNKWDSLKRSHDLLEKMNADTPEEEADTVDIDFKGLDHEEFISSFAPEDWGWANPNDERVQKKFNFKTSIGRQQYDAFMTYYGPTLPGYLDASNKVAELRGQYEEFMTLDTAPMFISAGGAGAGKTHSWDEIATENNLKELKEGDDPNDQDWAWVMCNDCETEEDLRKELAKYDGTYIDDNGDEHGRILVFDDADKLITTKSKSYINLIKKLIDNKPEKRVYKDPKTGETKTFKGRIVVMTNKDVGQIAASSPDMSAVMSRLAVNDMHFTRAESMDLIRERYKTIGFGDFQGAFEKLFPSKDKQQEVRQMVMDWLDDHYQEADPGKFTPRAFIQIMTKVAPKIARGVSNRRTASGSAIGTSTPWEIEALNLIKGEEDDLNVGDNNYTTEGLIDKKEKLERMKKELKKKNKKKYETIFGKKSINDFIFGSDVDEDEVEEDDETEKAMIPDFGDMSIDEATSLLLN